MKIGIIGSGNVGGTLGKRWAKAGNTVVFSSRDPQSEEMKKLLSEAGSSASAGSAEQAVKSGEVIVVATPWPATREALQSAGNFNGKVLIDATNPLKSDLSLDAGMTTSGAEQVAGWAAGARVVKAFNTVGNNIMANPKFAEAPASLLYCGDDADAKKTARELISQLGFDAVDVGPLSQARLLEPFAVLWITMAVKYGYGREIAFHFMKR
ncbi:MAG: NADPH-dependent F420 reductase [Acidobacteriaceae bacterium]|nr:NADPH-dependent F420 reductase [Acidobacteriaceae bacterium]MBV8571043.1 NADPH-dependent F420 reductase [Acidobacteriaceae bacterium]